MLSLARLYGGPGRPHGSPGGAGCSDCALVGGASRVYEYKASPLRAPSGALRPQIAPERLVSAQWSSISVPTESHPPILLESWVPKVVESRSAARESRQASRKPRRAGCPDGVLVGVAVILRAYYDPQERAFGALGPQTTSQQASPRSHARRSFALCERRRRPGPANTLESSDDTSVEASVVF